jgi:phosphatidylglycerol:prolipoprotein diacylglycerol transferase
MLPYFAQPVWRFGPLSIYAFGIAVAASVCVGAAIAERRFAHLGLDPVVGRRLGSWMQGGGFLGAHLFAVLVYFPDQLRDDPWLLLRVWEHISSFGGMLGGVAGALLFFAVRARDVERESKLAYLDGVAFAFPLALAIGRVGCALAHDHPGAVTTFPLAISLETVSALEYIGGVYASAGLPLPADAPTLGFHDLGLYECLFLLLVVVPLFARWNEKRRPTGFYLAAFGMLYLPVRFALDLLRVADVRYIGLTPAQWVAAFIMTALPFIALRHQKGRLTVAAVVVLMTAWACSAGGP